MKNFMKMLKAQWALGKFVCVGLDPDETKLPAHIRDEQKLLSDKIINFNRDIVDATKDLVCAFKPNSAFYEQYGVPGLVALEQTILHIKAVAPDVPVILDAKRADIGNTNDGYVKSAFDYFKADAITVHPYLGSEAMKPFLDRKDKGIIVLCRTSNKGAGEFQDFGNAFHHLYQEVAESVAQKWNYNGNCLLVVGATYPGELSTIRKIVGDMPILIPGIGAQGGDLEKSLGAGFDAHKEGIIINSSRGIIYASSGEDFAEAARRETEKLSGQIVDFRELILQGERA